MPGTEEREPMDSLEDAPLDEDPESSRTASLEENRAGFMLLDL